MVLLAEKGNIFSSFRNTCTQKKVQITILYESSCNSTLFVIFCVKMSVNEKKNLGLFVFDIDIAFCLLKPYFCVFFFAGIKNNPKQFLGCGFKIGKLCTFAKNAKDRNQSNTEGQHCNEIGTNNCNEKINANN